MYTAEQIIDRAFRENNLLPVGKTPNASQRSEALRLLSTMINSMLGTEIGRRVIDWTTPNFTTAPTNARVPLYPANVNIQPDMFPYPPANARLLLRLTAPQTVYFQQFPGDGAMMELVNLGPHFGIHPLTINANGFKIEGADQIVFDTEVAYLAPVRWIFRAELGEWRRLDFPLVEASEIPFADEFEDFWAAALAIRLSPLYGKSVGEATVGVAETGVQNIRSRYFQNTPDNNLSDPYLFNSYTSFGNSGGFFGGWYA